MALQNSHILIPRMSEYVTLAEGSQVADGIKLLIN